MSYESKCLKKLKDLGAPLEGWTCTMMIDEEYPAFVCELCGCEKVRFVHVMTNPDWYTELQVGCICAGVMEGDILAAKDRDRKVKNRAKRRQYFPRRKWTHLPDGSYSIGCKGPHVTIRKVGERYICYSDNEYTATYHNKPITDLLSAFYAAFDLADPIEEVWR